MDPHWILSSSEYYARMNKYILEVGLPYAIEDFQHCEEAVPYLRSMVGEGRGQLALDCSCGWGTQAIPLAKLGWQVTACDVSETSLEIARKYASREGVSVDFKLCDMRDLARLFNQQFDCVISCYGLYEISTEEGIRQAIHGMYTALKRGGKCFLEQRNMDGLMEEPRARHIFHGEKRTPSGRIICIDDWDYESESTVVEMHAFLREDESREPSAWDRWDTETIGVRKNVLRNAELERILLSEGFDPVVFIPQPESYFPIQILATRPK